MNAMETDCPEEMTLFDETRADVLGTQGESYADKSPKWNANTREFKHCAIRFWFCVYATLFIRQRLDNYGEYRECNVEAIKRDG